VDPKFGSDYFRLEKNMDYRNVRSARQLLGWAVRGVCGRRNMAQGQCHGIAN